jgi:hypothetical protein
MFLVLPVFAGLSASVSLNKKTVSVSESVTMKIEVQGARSVSQPQIVDMNNFQILSTSSSKHFGFYNGKTVNTTTFKYVIVPTSTGEFDVGQAFINADGKTIMVNPVKLTVVDNYSKGRSGSSPPPSAPDRYKKSQNSLPNTNISPADNIIFEADVNNTNPYLYEQIIYTIKLYIAKDVDQTNLETPDFKDFIVEKLDQQKQYYRFINGKNYNVVEQSYALFPTKTGKITIPPAFLTGRMLYYNDPFDTIFGNYSASPVNVRTSPVTLFVSKLPDGPEVFKNLVGSFNIKTEINKKSLKAGESAQLKITISGDGNIMNITNPDFNFTEEFKKSFKIYKLNPVTHFYSKKDYISGQRIFKYDIVALKAGNYIIPPAEIAYFNPLNKSFRQLKSEVIPIIVTPGDSNEVLDVSTNLELDPESEISQLNQLIDIHTPEKPLEDNTLSNKVYLTLAAIFVFPLIILLGCFIFSKKQEKQKENTLEISRKKAYKKAIKGLKRLSSLVKGGQTRTFFNELDDILKTYIGEKLNVPGKSLTSKDVENLLHKYEINSKTIFFIVEILKLCELSQFSTIDKPDKKISIAYKDTKRILKLLEKELKKCKNT